MAETLKIKITATPRKFKSERMTRVMNALGELPGLMDSIGEKLTREIKRNLSGRVLNKRSGRLHDSWEWLVEPAERGWRLEVASDVVYARIQDLGGRTGRNYATYIPASQYVQKALDRVKPVQKLMRDYITRVMKG